MKAPVPMPPPMQLPPNLQKIMADPEYLAELMQNPTWEEVETLLKDDAMLGFRIDIETDSTIQEDEQEEKANVVELVTAITQFIQGSAEIQDPQVRVFMAELLGFSIRRFKAGKQIEGAVELLIKHAQDMAKNPTPPPPNPEQIKAQSAMQVAQLQNQQKQQESAANLQLERDKAQLEQQTNNQQKQLDMQQQAQLHAQEMELEREKMQNEMILEKYKIDAKMKLDHDLGMVQHAVTATTASQQMAKDDEGKTKQDQSTQQTKDLMDGLSNHLKVLHDHITAPKSVKVIRNQDGSMTGTSS